MDSEHNLISDIDGNRKLDAAAQQIDQALAYLSAETLDPDQWGVRTELASLSAEIIAARRAMEAGDSRTGGASHIATLTASVMATVASARNLIAGPDIRLREAQANERARAEKAFEAASERFSTLYAQFGNARTVPIDPNDAARIVAAETVLAQAEQSGDEARIREARLALMRAQEADVASAAGKNDPAANALLPQLSRQRQQAEKALHDIEAAGVEIPPAQRDLLPPSDRLDDLVARLKAQPSDHRLSTAEEAILADGTPSAFDRPPPPAARLKITGQDVHSMP